jgi:thiol-disulfide isomerase/thioredoxin
LLINGGGKREINYWSHLDHLHSLLRLLDANGVAPARVAVFSGDGQDPAADLATREGELPPDFGLLPRSVSSRLRPPIEYVSSEIAGIALRPATRDALRTWFEFDGKGLLPGDTLLFYVTDHGEKNPDDFNDNTISLWGEKLSVSDLRELLALLDPGVRVVMLMSQCYSGSFANTIFVAGADGPGVLPQGNVCGFFSTTADRRAVGCYAEVSGKDDIGHSHRVFDALNAGHRFPDVQREVLVTDATPDVPNATTSFFLAQQLAKAAQRGGHETPELIDRFLTEALADPLAWEQEIRLLDRVGQAFGFASPRSLAVLEERERELSRLRDQLALYAKRWERTLDTLLTRNLALFKEQHPEWKKRLANDALAALDSDGRRRERDDLLYALVRFTEADRDLDARLRDLAWKKEEAKAARYRADVRLAVVLRMRGLLTDVAGRHYMSRHSTDDEREAFDRLDACEDLALATPVDSELAEAFRSREPFPTLAQEKRRLEAILPGWLGMSYRPARAIERKRYDLPSGAAVVKSVLPDSPATEAGLEPADIVLGPPDAPFTESHAVREWAMQGEIGRPLSLLILRDGEELELTVYLRPYPLELPKLPGPPQIGSTAPELELEYLAEARPPEPWQSRMYFFWATWCSHCKEALPELMAFERERGIPVVAVTDEDPRDIASFRRSYDGPLPEIVAADRRRKSFRRYGVSGTPTFVLVDADGTVRHYQAGYTAGLGIDIEGWRWDGRAATR